MQREGLFFSTASAARAWLGVGQCAAWARTGSRRQVACLMDVARHHADIEAVYTYEGTDTMQSLIMGRAITGIDAFA